MLKPLQVFLPPSSGERLCIIHDKSISCLIARTTCSRFCYLCGGQTYIGLYNPSSTIRINYSLVWIESGIWPRPLDGFAGCVDQLLVFWDNGEYQNIYFVYRGFYTLLVALFKYKNLLKIFVLTKFDELHVCDWKRLNDWLTIKAWMWRAHNRV